MNPHSPPGSAWGVFGTSDQLGTLNCIKPEHVLAAAELVHRGHVFPLNLDLWSPSPALFHRTSPSRIPARTEHGPSINDYLDNFYPHASTHWDALRHYADVDFGFYNGATLDAISAPDKYRPLGGPLGTEGHVGRGVLL